MRKIVVLLMAVMFSFAVVGCGKKETPPAAPAAGTKPEEKKADAPKTEEKKADAPKAEEKK